MLEGFVTKGGLERDGQYLVIREARAEEAQKEVESWLRKIKVLKPIRGNYEKKKIREQRARGISPRAWLHGDELWIGTGKTSRK